MAALAAGPLIGLGLQAGLPLLVKLADKLFGGKKDALGATAGAAKMNWTATTWKAIQDVLVSVGAAPAPAQPITIEQAKAEIQPVVDRLNAAGELVGHQTVMEPGGPSAAQQPCALAKAMLRLAMEDYLQ